MNGFMDEVIHRQEENSMSCTQQIYHFRISYVFVKSCLSDESAYYFCFYFFSSSSLLFIDKVSPPPMKFLFWNKS